MWKWFEDFAGAVDKNRLVDANGADVLIPVGTVGCSPYNPDSHGIRVSPENAKLIAALPEIVSTLKSLTNAVRVASESKEFVGTFTIADIHGAPYTGPTYEHELIQAINLIETLSL